MTRGLLGIDPENLGDIGLGLAAVLGGAAALLTIWAALRSWYRRTLGRRRDRYERLARLGTQALLSFFQSVLGEPPAMRKTITAEVSEYNQDAGKNATVKRDFLECFFIDRDYYVQVVCDLEETVLAFSVTTRSSRFRPTFSFPPKPSFQGRRRWKKLTGNRFQPFFRVTLGRTRFDRLSVKALRPRRKIEGGARLYMYTELFSYGNPGHYQSFGFTSSSAASQGQLGEFVDVIQALGPGWTDRAKSAELGELEDHPLLKRFRRETVITTYTVLGPTMWAENYPTTFGPHGDEVRTLP